MQKKRSEEISGDISGVNFPLAQIIIIVVMGVVAFFVTIWKLFKGGEK